MTELGFLFADMVREINDFAKVAARFLDGGSVNDLTAFRSTLESIQSSAPIRGVPNTMPDEGYPWEIPRERPIVTKPSRAYERGERSGGPEICAAISSVWMVRPELRANRAAQSKRFALTGLASVRVEWWETLEGELYENLGMWRMEVADGNSPGCYFHIQILGETERTIPPFPHSVPVPRLPCIAFTPMAVLEFVLGELFQDEWEAHLTAGPPGLESWRSAQRTQLTRLLDWQRRFVTECRAGTPWMALKLARPESDLFLRTR